MISTILVPIGLVVYLKLNRFYQFVVLSLAALLPLSFGNFRSVPNLHFIEWIPFFTLLMLINELIPVKTVNRKQISLSYNGLQLFIFALIILLVWAAHSFISNELLVSTIKHIKPKNTIRTYFRIVNNIIIFFTTIIFVNLYFEEIDFEKYFKILLSVALFLGLIRIASHFLDFKIPLLEGAFDYGGEYGKFAKAKYGGTAFRLGGLSEVVIIGIPALFARYLYTRKMDFVALLLLLLFLFMSGGRTVMVGTFFSIGLFSLLFFRKNLIIMIMAGALFILLALIFLPDSILQGQSGRLTTIYSENFMGQDAHRGLAWKFLIDSFIENPFWGKGISTYSGFIYSEVRNAEDFARTILFSGGHGSYFSIMSTLGVGGLFYFLVMIYGGIFVAFIKIKQFREIDTDIAAIAIFVFLLLIIKSVDFITASNGLNVPILFFAVGFVASIRVYQNRIDVE